MAQATQIVHWPGKDTFACDKHATQIRGMANVMGFNVSSTIMLDYNVECDNCRNEEKKDIRVKGEDEAELEHIASIAERVFPEEVAEIRSPKPLHSHEKLFGKTDWDRECQESGGFNKR